ncbi:MAG: hypothetical protein LBH25_10905 [Fibromonadaceae bacterium]|jgi:hypothetical protein|nr:hypothetical protein [Fibromonadaceae bacterium]
MNKVRFLAKITMAASIFACLTFTVSCSDDKGDNNGGGSTGKWCVFGPPDEPRCIEVGTKYGDGYTMTEEMCKLQFGYSIKDEKPDCKIFTGE